MRQRPSIKGRLIASLVVSIVGAGAALLAASFATLYVPVCAEFSLSSQIAVCRGLTGAVYATFAFTALGVLSTCWVLLRWLISRSGPGRDIETNGAWLD